MPVSDERLEELYSTVLPWHYQRGLLTPEELSDIDECFRELQTLRAASALAAQVVDVEGLRGILLYFQARAAFNQKPDGYERGAAIIRAHLSALEAGVTECPECGGRGKLCNWRKMTCDACPTPLNERDCEPCETCNGAGRVVIMAALEVKEASDA